MNKGLVLYFHVFYPANGKYCTALCINPTVNNLMTKLANLGSKFLFDYNLVVVILLRFIDLGMFDGCLELTGTIIHK